jgi:hypothetical protein
MVKTKNRFVKHNKKQNKTQKLKQIHKNFTIKHIKHAKKYTRKYRKMYGGNTKEENERTIEEFIVAYSYAIKNEDQTRTLEDQDILINILLANENKHDNNDLVNLILDKKDIDLQVKLQLLSQILKKSAQLYDIGIKQKLRKTIGFLQSEISKKEQERQIKVKREEEKRQIKVKQEEEMLEIERRMIQKNAKTHIEPTVERKLTLEEKNAALKSAKEAAELKAAKEVEEAAAKQAEEAAEKEAEEAAEKATKEAAEKAAEEAATKKAVEAARLQQYLLEEKEKQDRALQPALELYKSNLNNISRFPRIIPEANVIDYKPTLWLPYFNNNIGLLRYYRQKMRNILNDKSICNVLQKYIKTYSSNTEQVVSGVGNDNFDEQYNLYLCFIFIAFGLITQLLEFERYKVVFKGGKAIQLALLNKNSLEKHYSDDIDILIIPKEIQYNQAEIITIAQHIRNFIMWLAPEPTQLISKLDVSSYIIKISYNNGKKKALVDIDYRRLPDYSIDFFRNTEKIELTVTELDDLKLVFELPTFDSIVNEKLYYLIQFTNLQETTPHSDNIFQLSKIYKALKTLIAASVTDIADVELQKDNLRKLLLQKDIPEIKIAQIINNMYNPQPSQL